MPVSSVPQDNSEKRVKHPRMSDEELQELKATVMSILGTISMLIIPSIGAAGKIPSPLMGGLTIAFGSIFFFSMIASIDTTPKKKTLVEKIRHNVIALSVALIILALHVVPGAFNITKELNAKVVSWCLLGPMLALTVIMPVAVCIQDCRTERAKNSP